MREFFGARQLDAEEDFEIKREMERLRDAEVDAMRARSRMRAWRVESGLLSRQSQASSSRSRLTMDLNRPRFTRNVAIDPQDHPFRLFLLVLIG
jgi:hypothetical protein